MKKGTKVCMVLTLLAMGCVAGFLFGRNFNHTPLTYSLPGVADFSEENEHSTSSKEEKININAATAEELALLPGISPSQAGQIVSYREENGLFQTAEDLTEVKGISTQDLDALLDYITIGAGR